MSATKSNKGVSAKVPQEQTLEYWKAKALELESRTRSKDEDDEDIYISPDKSIRVMSLCNHLLNLTTGNDLKAKKRSFDHYGQVKSVPFSMLTEFVEHAPTFAENGVYYILDRDAVKKLGLEEAYAKILDRKDIDKILNVSDSDTALALYKSLNKRQREYVNEMLIEKIRRNEVTDLSLISAIGRVAEIDLMDRVKKSTEFFELHPEMATQ